VCEVWLEINLKELQEATLLEMVDIINPSVLSANELLFL
jgi:hypothetical protein